MPDIQSRRLPSSLSPPLTQSATDLARRSRGANGSRMARRGAAGDRRAIQATAPPNQAGAQCIPPPARLPWGGGHGWRDVEVGASWPSRCCGSGHTCDAWAHVCRPCCRRTSPINATKRGAPEGGEAHQRECPQSHHHRNGFKVRGTFRDSCVLGVGPGGATWGLPCAMANAVGGAGNRDDGAGGAARGDADVNLAGAIPRI